ncbi:MAG: hypothetical protein ACKOQ6_13350 [Bacteroidota bacterium]
MALSEEQQKELRKLAVELEKLESYAIENNLDLDVFVSHYTENGYSDHSTEQVSLEEKSVARKKAYARAGKQKTAVKSN